MRFLALPTPAHLVALCACASLVACGGEPETSDPAIAPPPEPIAGLYFLPDDQELYRFDPDGTVMTTWKEAGYELLNGGGIRLSLPDGVEHVARYERSERGLRILAEIEGKQMETLILKAEPYAGADSLAGDWQLVVYYNGELEGGRPSPSFGGEPVTLDARGLLRSAEGAPFCRLLLGGGEAPQLEYRDFAEDGSFQLVTREVEIYQAGSFVVVTEGLHEPGQFLIIEQR